jgi:hypothetical protein
LFSQIGENRLAYGKHQLDAKEAEIQNGYDNAAIVMEYKEDLFGADNKVLDSVF